MTVLLIVLLRAVMFKGSRFWVGMDSVCMHDLCVCVLQVSEDCLYLNVFIPLSVNFSNPVLKLPVMVWIHGGDFIAGSASKPLYDSRFISNFTHTVVVSVAYRLGNTHTLTHKHSLSFSLSPPQRSVKNSLNQYDFLDFPCDCESYQLS